jgi:hypothetical protein
VLLSAHNLLDLRLGLPQRAWFSLFDGTIVASGLACIAFAGRRERLPWWATSAGCSAP